MDSNLFHNNRTIAALATAPAPAGVAIIRISGTLAKNAICNLFSSKKNPLESPRTACYGRLIDSTTKEIVDHGLAIFYPAPNSFTGEDIVEFHIHGSPLLVNHLLKAIYQQDIDPAEPGEFSKRAFLNNKIDLIQAEAIADMISASSIQALKTAKNHYSGSLSKYINEIADGLRNLLAQIEAHLDFPEEDINPDDQQALLDTLLKQLNFINTLKESFSYGQKLRDGYRVLIAGPPNAGKSSLLNRLLGRERAIVTEISGTTRDLIEESVEIGGHTFVICDSAGITQTSDKVEAIGVELALSKLSWADLILLVYDVTDSSNLRPEIEKLINEYKNKVWHIYNKIDLISEHNIRKQEKTCFISTLAEDGISSLKTELISHIEKNKASSADGSLIVTNSRHFNHLLKASHSLTEAAKLLSAATPQFELVSLELKTALEATQEIIGKTYTEDILGRIFTRFCIGK